MIIEGHLAWLLSGIHHWLRSEELVKVCGVIRRIEGLELAFEGSFMLLETQFSFQLLCLLLLPSFHLVAHFSTRSEAVDVEVWGPEKLAEILGALQLHLDVLHVSIEVVDENRAVLAVLVKELFKLVHVLGVRPAGALLLRLSEGTSGRFWTRSSLNSVLFLVILLSRIEVFEGVLRVLDVVCLLPTFSDEREGALIVSHEGLGLLATDAILGVQLRATYG